MVLPGDGGEQRAPETVRNRAYKRLVCPHRPHERVKVAGSNRHVRERHLVRIPTLAKTAGGCAEIAKVDRVARLAFDQPILDEAQRRVGIWLQEGLAKRLKIVRADVFIA